MGGSFLFPVPFPIFFPSPLLPSLRPYSHLSLLRTWRIILLTRSPISNPWDVPSNDNALVGAYIAEFAMGSLAQMVDRNWRSKPLFLNGMVPRLGSQISVRWRYFEGLLVAIVAVHTIVVGANWWALKMTPVRREGRGV